MTPQNEVVYDKAGNAHEVVDFNNDYIGAKLGFWLFLFTELMLFGAMFLVFAFYFYKLPEEFVASSEKLNLLLGGANTFILLFSTYFMGMSLVHLKNNEVQKCKKFIYITLTLSCIFLFVKYLEWQGEISHGIYPDSELLNSMSHGTILFFGLYFTMTGLHGLHVIVGIGVMLWVAGKINKKGVTAQNFIVLENTALYWDLVHIVWVFLFPLFYMIGV